MRGIFVRPVMLALARPGTDDGSELSRPVSRPGRTLIPRRFLPQTGSERDQNRHNRPSGAHADACTEPQRRGNS